MFKWEPKNLEEARLPVLMLSWIFGFGIIQYPLNHLRIGLTLCYLSCCVCIYIVLLWYCITFLLSVGWIEREEQLYILIVVTNIVLMNINILIAWIHRNSTVQISRKSIALEEILKTLGISALCLKRAFCCTLLLIFTWIITSFGLNALSLLWLDKRTTLINNIAMVLTFQHPMHVNTSIELNFSASIRDMGLRLKCINRLLLMYSKVKVNDWILNSYHLSPVHHSYHSKKKISSTSSLSQHEAPHPNVNKILHIIKYLHLEINVLCNRIMVLYGFQLCIILSISFVVITSMCYAMWLNAFNQSLTTSERILRGFVLLGWIVIYIMKLSLTNIVCALTATEYKRTGEIIHQIEIQSQDKELIRSIQQFSIQIMQNPLVFSPCGFIQLGYPLIKNFIGSITTYLVIIIQMSDQNTVPNN